MKPQHWILDEHGEAEPVADVIEWARWFENSMRHLEKTVILAPDGEITVSTVFLGLDHSFTDHGPPVLWETMVFAPDYPEVDQQTTRYSSRETALSGHADAVDYVKTLLGLKA